MNEKRSIEEIMESIFMLVTEASNTNMRLTSKEKVLEKLTHTTIQSTASPTTQSTASPTTQSTASPKKEILQKETKRSDWSKYKFSSSRNNIIKKFDGKNFVKDILKKKLKKKLQLELENFINKKIKKLVETEAKKHTENLIKQKIKKV